MCQRESVPLLYTSTRYFAFSAHVGKEQIGYCVSLVAKVGSSYCFCPKLCLIGERFKV